MPDDVVDWVPNSASDLPESARPRRGELDVFRGDYVPFAVAALDNLHGRARRKSIIDEARQLLGARLKTDDFKRVSERKRLPRWRYRLGWALSQARQRGYLKKVAGERGVRVLTAEGKPATARERIARKEI
jgi:hypothetical protein